MRARRSTKSGVTLIEMLVALSISTMIGLAGFILLESVTRTEAGVSGRLEQLKLQDRAFHLLLLDMDNAGRAVFEDDLALTIGVQRITWRAADSGLIRRINIEDRPAITQRILDEPTRFTVPPDGGLVLTLPDTDVWRMFPLPRDPVQ